MRQATYTGQQISTEAYCRLLLTARETAVKYHPGMTVQGIRLQNGVWFAITSAGDYPIRELSRAKPSDYNLSIPRFYGRNR